jgi:hypothetical protein
MAQPHHHHHNNDNNSVVLHDFLGMKPAHNPPKTADVRLSETSSAAARAPFSATSDIASGEFKIPSFYFLNQPLFTSLVSFHFSLLIKVYNK